MLSTRYSCARCLKTMLFKHARNHQKEGKNVRNLACCKASNSNPDVGLSADPLSLDKVVRRVVTSAPSLFPSPRGPKTLQFVLPRSFGDGRRAFFLASNRYRLSKPFRDRFWSTLGPILRPFWVPKSVPNGTSHRHANAKANINPFHVQLSSRSKVF